MLPEKLNYIKSATRFSVVMITTTLITVLLISSVAMGIFCKIYTYKFFEAMLGFCGYVGIAFVVGSILSGIANYFSYWNEKLMWGYTICSFLIIEVISVAINNNSIDLFSISLIIPIYMLLYFPTFLGYHLLKDWIFKDMIE